MNYLTVENLTKSYADKELFNAITFYINQGQKVAFIAKNGTGKTTLLNILSGKETPDGGSVSIHKDVKVGYLPQAPHLDDELTVSQAIFSGNNAMLEAIRNYENSLDNPHDEKRMETAVAAMDSLHAWDYDVKAKQILSQLGIEQLGQRVGTLSGGQQKRLALAKVLIEEPQFLILDEPTNHLDLDMIEWLEQYLTKPGITLFMVTHDRYFMERVCDEILELDQGNIYKYKGNYSYFLEKKTDRQENDKVNVEKAKSMMRKELEWIRRMPKARGTKAKSRVDAFEGIKKQASKNTDEKLTQLEIKTERLGSKILELHKVSKSYGDLKLVEGFSYKFQPRERVGIVGKNGAGKSTLLNIMTDNMPPSSGKVVVGDTVLFGFYKQEGMQLKDGQKVIDVVRDIADVIPMTGGRHLTAEQLLERFLFNRKVQYNYVSTLSGGEKRRLYLLTVLMKNPNFLILDEPTNDLDIATLQILEDFLAQYPGCLLIVSHDRYFMDRLVDHLFVMEDGGHVRDFPGNYSQYRDWKGQQLPEKKKESTSKPKQEKTKPQEKKRLGFNEKREFAQLEGDIEQLEQRKAKIEELLGTGMDGHEELTRLTQELGEVINSLDQKTDRWLELSEYA